MRKIAANYICLPGFPMIKNGYVVLNGRQVVDVVDTGGVITEIPALEFYGGMIVAGYLADTDVEKENGRDLRIWLEERYGAGQENCGLAIVEGADLFRMVFQQGTVISKLV